MSLLIAVFDKKASEYQPPQAFPNLATALRAYASVSRQQPNSNLVQFPEDFDLYAVANFDELNGMVEPVNPPQFLEHMSSLVQQQPQQEEIKNGKR